MMADEERSERIKLIRDSAAAVVPVDGSLTRVRSLRFGDRDFDRDVWAAMAEMGWLGLMLPEDDGGAGMGLGEYCALAEMLGRGLVPEPFVAVAAILPAVPHALRSSVLFGMNVVLPAWQNGRGGIDVLTEDATDGMLTGVRRSIAGARDADGFLVLARNGLWHVAADTPGLRIESVPSQDGGSLGTVHLEGVAALSAPGDANTLLAYLSLGTAAYLFGVAERAFEITLDHLRTRQQFNRAIGSFQALQHRAADLLVQIELARASVAAAARAADAGASGDALARSVSRAKARASDVAMLVTRSAIQLHGGIGFADESDIGLYLRKAMVVANQAGSAGWHRKRYGRLLAA